MTTTIRHFGYKRAPDGGPRNRNAAPYLGSGVPPEEADNTGMTIVLDQGPASSCTAHSINGNLRSAQIRAGAPADTPIASRLLTYWITRAFAHEQWYDAGGFLHLGFQGLVEYGFAPESAWPYDLGRITVQPPLSAIERAFPSRAAGRPLEVEYHRILSVGAARVDDVKRALGAGLNVSFGTQVDQAFQSGAFGPDGFWTPPADGVATNGHAMLMCGHNRRGVKVVNSWGPEWNAGGYVWMTWDVIEDDRTDDLWIVTKAPMFEVLS